MRNTPLIILSLAALSLCFHAGAALAAQPVEEEAPQEEDGITELQRQAYETVQQYEQAILAIEDAYGPYHGDLGQSFAGLGRAYTSLEEHDLAAQSFKRALQVERVNNGLNSEQQLPVLEELLASNIARKDWPAVDANQQLRFYLNSHNREITDIRLVRAIDQLGRWNIRVFREGLLGKKSVAPLVESERHYREAIAAVEASEGDNDEARLALYFGHAETQYALAAYTASLPVTSFSGSGSPDTVRTVCRSYVNSQGETVRSCHQVRSPNPNYFSSMEDSKNQRISFHLGSMKKTLGKIAAITEKSGESATEAETADMDTYNDLVVRHKQATRELRR